MVEGLEQEFSLEAFELLDNSEDALLDFDKGSEFNACYQAVFRCFHSLKGSAGMLGLEQLQKHMHLLEDRFQGYVDQEDKLKSNIDYFLMGIDAARELIKGNQIEFDYRVEGAPQIAQDETLSPEHLKDINNKLFLVGIDKDVASFIADNFKSLEVMNIGLDKSLVQFDNCGGVAIFIVSGDQISQVKDMMLEPDQHVYIAYGEEVRNHIMWVEEHGAANLKVIIECERRAKMNEVAFSRALMLVLYQLGDLENYLKAQNKTTILTTIKQETKKLMVIKKSIDERYNDE